MKPKMSWKKLMNEIREANRDPEFVKAARRFVNITSNQTVYKEV